MWRGCIFGTFIELTAITTVQRHRFSDWCLKEEKVSPQLIQNRFQN